MDNILFLATIAPIIIVLGAIAWRIDKRRMERQIQDEQERMATAGDEYEPQTVLGSLFKYYGRSSMDQHARDKFYPDSPDERD